MIGLSQPADQLVVDLIKACHSPTLWVHIPPADVNPGLGGWLDQGELIGAAKADPGLLGGQLDIVAEVGDDLDKAS